MNYLEIVVDYTMQIPELQRNVLLLILDGVGVSRKSKGNAVTLANPQNLIRLWNAFPHTYLKASSESVGLPENTNGNSEVGHLNIGAGRVMYQNLPKINKSIKQGHYLSNNMLLQAIDFAKKNGSNIHLLGCLSDGSTHAHTDHFLATLETIKHVDFKQNVFIHAFTDGRDTPPTSASEYLTKVQKKINELGIGTIASLCGRSLAMDRNKSWSRTKLAYDMLISGTAKIYESWQNALDDNYKNSKTDEFILPSIIKTQEKLPTISENDVVIFLNFRSDRAIQLSHAIASPEFNQFPTVKFQNIFFCSMVEYEKGFPNKVLFPKEYIKIPLGRIISENGLSQLRIAESEKYPHVTYFFNGGVNLKYQSEDRIEIQSPAVPTYDLKPEMSALEILNKTIPFIQSDRYNLIVMNLANGDMVAHTGNLEASIKSVQVLDYVTARLVDYCIARNWTVVITADHGNVEELINLQTGEIDTEHSQNLVPFMVINKKLGPGALNIGSLSDISPTILKLLSINKPAEMSGISLI
jgi:2,3-bisphosphoglycerate-independent phosphoglycerate mutase